MGLRCWGRWHGGTPCATWALQPSSSFLLCRRYWLPAGPVASIPSHLSSAAAATGCPPDTFPPLPLLPLTSASFSCQPRAVPGLSAGSRHAAGRGGGTALDAHAGRGGAECCPALLLLLLLLLFVHQRRFLCNKSWGACPLLPPANCPAFPVVLVRKAGVACRCLCLAFPIVLIRKAELSCRCRCLAFPVVLIRKAGLLRCRRCPAFPIVLIGRLPRPLFSVTITSSHTQLPWHVVFGPKNAAGRSGSCRAASAVPAFTHFPCTASLPPLQSEGRHYGEASCRDYRLSVLAALPHRCGVSSRPPAFCQCRTGDCVLSAAPVNVLRSVMQQSCQFVIDSAPCCICVAAVALYSCPHVQP